MAIGPAGIIHVVWVDDSRLGNPWMTDILYTSGDGVQWADPVQLSGMDTTFSFLPRIAVDSEGRPHVVWNHRSIFPDAAIYYTTLTDTGWLEPVNLTLWSSTRYMPDIAIDGNGLIHVIWTDYIFGNGEIVHSYFDGEAWSPIENVSNDSIASGWSRILADSENHLHVVWANIADVGIQCQVYYTFFDGVTWSQAANLSLTDSLPSIRPELALDAYDHAHVVWNQVTQWGSSSVIEEIFYRYFDGQSWSLAENITNLGLRTADYPQIAVSSQGAKCIFFGLSRDNGDPYVNYIFGYNSHWTYPDTLFDDYQCLTSNLIVDDCGAFHACVPIGFEYFADIGYTLNESFNQVVTDPTPICLIQPAFQLYPNPSNSIIKIQYDFPLSSATNLYIYDARGQLIRELQSGNQIAGVHEEFWDGTNQFRKEVSSGVYFIRLVANGEPITKRLTLIK